MKIAKLKVLCPDDKETYAEAEVDLTKVDVQVDDSHTNKVLIDEDKKIGVLMKYPTINSIDPTSDFSKSADSKTLFDVISKDISN